MFFYLKSEWQQVFSGLQDSSNYPWWFEQCYDLDGFDTSSTLQFVAQLAAAAEYTDCIFAEG